MGHYLRKVNDLMEKILGLEREFNEDSCKLKVMTGLKPEYGWRLTVNDNVTLGNIQKMKLAEFAEMLLKLEPIVEP